MTHHRETHDRVTHRPQDRTERVGTVPDQRTVGPLHPRRERLPLPRRAEQTHLEPQLCEPGSAGTGTPFAAFDPGGPAGAAVAGPGRVPATGRAATFREATRRPAQDRSAPGQRPKGPADSR